MGDPRVKIFVKLLFDLLFLSAVLSTYFLEIFEYKSDYNIGAVNIFKESTYKINNTESTPLTEVVIATYKQFEDHFCDDAKDDTKDVCDRRKDFETAGILLMIFSSLSQFLCLYAILGMMGMGCGCSCCGFLRFTFVNYVYPFIYAIGIVCFVFVSQMFMIDDVKLGIGIFFVFSAQGLAVLSAMYFCVYRKTMNALILVTHEEYQPMKK
jgi:hypothetical protein